MAQDRGVSEAHADFEVGNGAQLMPIAFSDVLLVVLFSFFLLVWLPKRLLAYARQQRLIKAAKLKRKD